MSDPLALRREACCLKADYLADPMLREYLTIYHTALRHRIVDPSVSVILMDICEVGDSVSAERDAEVAKMRAKALGPMSALYG